MKPARIAVLLIALVAGGIAALLAGRSELPPPIVVAAAPQLETVEVLIAAADIGMGSTLAPQQMRWQTWPAAAAGPNFIRKEAKRTRSMN
jgi:pilus assembly protein CpaB